MFNIKQIKPHYFLHAINRLIKYCWESPTITSWAALLAQSVGLLTVLPLVLALFKPADVTLYFVFMAAISMQLYLRMGFQPTFIRLIGYTFAGLEPSSMLRIDRFSSMSRNDLNVHSLRLVVGTMRSIHLRLLTYGLPVYIIIGSFSLIKPIQSSSFQSTSWIVWVLIIFTTGVRVWGGQYESYLRGQNLVALVARNQAIFNFVSIISVASVLAITENLPLALIFHQFIQVLIVLRLHFLCALKDKKYAAFSKSANYSAEVFSAAWPSAWRTGLAVIFGAGFTQSIGVIYASFGEATIAASFLLAIRLMTAIDQYSMAPFYSRIPHMNKLAASRDFIALTQATLRGMQLTHLTIILGWSLLFLFSDLALQAISSETEFVSSSLWVLIGLAFWAQRYASMHLQHHSTLNNIVTHWGVMIQASTTILAITLLLPTFGILALPGGMILGNVVYAAFSVRFSYPLLVIKWWKFELRTISPAILVILGFMSLYIFVH